MLSYRHAFHAGNHADVLKHHILVEVLHYLNQKEKPWRFIDTHAGAGFYALGEGSAFQNTEVTDGIARLWQSPAIERLEPIPAKEALLRYLAQVGLFNPDSRLGFYPGSPALARSLARPMDDLRFFERHPTDHAALVSLFENEARVQVRCADGFAGFSAFWPPTKGRAFLFMDPSYELQSDYVDAIDTLKQAQKRFPAGVILLWYPLLARATVRQLERKLSQCGAPSWLHARLWVKAPPKEGIGLYGSGVFLIRPPWTLQTTLQETLPVLVRHLGCDEKAGFTLNAHFPSSSHR
jgi:23S rRNA (adenine2030-N6)-methyltransferase